MKMLSRIGMGGVAACALMFSAAPVAADTPVDTTPTRASDKGTEGAAPDVWVCTLPSTVHWGSSGGIHAFSIATTSANAGNVNLNWIQNSTQHPVIAQNMYRLKDGVLEQIGMSWLKHGFCALQQNLAGCGSCPGGGGCLSFLQPGCADPYSASLNAQTSNLGPRSEVNPVTGAFQWPFTQSSTGSSTIRARLQVPFEYVDPNQNPGARWFAEGQYIHPQDAQADLGDNNASYREINFNGFPFGSPSGVPNVSSTVGMDPAIRAWEANVPGVILSELNKKDGSDGLMIVGSHAQDLGGGMWKYDYAVYNMNSHRSAGSFSVPVPSGVSVSDIRFHAPHYHSGEPYSNADWTATEGGGAVTWSTESFAQNQNANAIRWGTMYNFGFVANAAPDEGDLTVGMFRPSAGDPDSFDLRGAVPAGAVCIGDLNGDDVVDGADLAALLSQWGMGGSADLNGSGEVDGADLALLLANWGGC